MRLRVLAILVLGCWCWNLNAHNLPDLAAPLTVRDGLPQGVVSALVQDKQGFLWIGTRDGLARYDGRQFSVFRHKPGDKTSIGSSQIFGIARDKKGLLWIFFEDMSLDLFDPVRETFTHHIYKPTQARLIHRSGQGTLMDPQGFLWLIQPAYPGTFIRFNPRTKSLKKFTAGEDGLPAGLVRGVCASRKGPVWLATDSGLARWDPVTKKSAAFPLDMGPTMESDRRFAMTETGDGRIAVLTSVGLILLDPANGQVQRFGFPGSPQEEDLRMAMDSKGVLYAERNGKIFRCRPGEPPVLYWQNQGGKPYNNAYSLFVDRSDVLWVGTNGKGLRRINLKTPDFRSKGYEVLSFHADALYSELNIPLSDIPDAESWSVSFDFRSRYDRQGRLWLQYPATGQLGYWGSVLKKMVWMPAVNDEDCPKCQWSAFDIDRDGRIWRVTNKGIPFFFDSLQMRWVAPLGIDPAVFGFPSKTQLVDMVAEGNRLWVTTAGRGLFVYDLKAKKLERFRPSNGLSLPGLIGLQRDISDRDVLWIGSRGGGLIRLNTRTGDCQVFDKEDGLPDNTVYALTFDRQGYLWLSTNNGLCRFHPETKKVHNFSALDGLPGDEFNTMFYLPLPDGRLIFGGMDGWVVFDPSDIREDTFQPSIHLVGLKVNNEIPKNLTGALGALKKLELSAEENFLTFEFASLQFNQPQQIRYRYQMADFDKAWIEAGNQPYANYTNLPPGSYVFRVNATNTSGLWSKEVYEIPVVIYPPPYQTIWAYLFYAVAILSFILAAWKFQKKRLLLRQEMALRHRENEQLREIDEIKTRFFSSITHEIRTPLSLILTPSGSLLQSNRTPKEVRQSIQLIHENARVLLRLVNQLLDLSSLEAGKMEVAYARGRIPAFVEQIAGLFRSSLEDKGLELRYRVEAPMEDYLFDAEKLEKILFNLLSNAVKFTPKGGEIHIDLRLENETLEITVSDTGIGIAPEHLEHIFDRFYQVNTTVSPAFGGTGIGLALVKELTELLGGKIEVRSRSGEGTSFMLSLPVRKAGNMDAPLAALTELVVAEETPVVSMPPAQESASGQRELPLLLIAEDNEGMRQFLAAELGQYYRTVAVENGQEAWEFILQELPDLVLSDVMMPKMDGYALCNLIKSDPRTNHIAVVLLTAKTAQQSRMKGLEVHADDYLTKPFHTDELLTRLSNLWSRQLQLQAYFQNQASEPGESSSGISVASEFVNELHEIIDRELDNSDFGVEQLAEAMNMSQRTLHRKVFSITGLKPNKFIRDYRLRKAAALLKAGKTVTEAAFSVGFENTAYFSTCFKELFRCAPSDYHG